MTTYVALLRAVNVRGKNRVSMTELRAALGADGLESVSTVLQSGNVLLRSTEPEAAVATRVRNTIEKAFALRVGVIVRSASEVAAIASRNPFLAAAETVEPTTLHVAFLAEHPSDATVSTLDPARSPLDAFVVDGREVFLRYPNGSGRSQLTLGYIERTLGTQGTARNWRTVERLAPRAEGESATQAAH